MERRWRVPDVKQAPDAVTAPGAFYFLIDANLSLTFIVVIPEAILIGNPALNQLKAWIPD